MSDEMNPVLINDILYISYYMYCSSTSIIHIVITI